MEALTATHSLTHMEVGAELLTRYISYLDTSQQTVNTYTRALRQLFKFLSVNGIRQPERKDIIAFKEELINSGHKATTVQNYLTATKLFFRWTAQEGLYPNITDHLKAGKVSREFKRDYLSGNQVKDILTAIDLSDIQGLRDYALIALMVTGGLRTVEVSRALVKDIETKGDAVVLHVQGKGYKGDDAPYIKLSPKVERALRAYLKARGSSSEEEPLFVSMSNNSKGAHLSTRSIRGIVKSRLKEAGFCSERKTAHSLRHTAVTLSLLAGKDIREVKQFARHADIATTLIYDHSLEIAKNSCAEAVAEAIF